MKSKATAGVDLQLPISDPYLPIPVFVSDERGQLSRENEEGGNSGG